MTTKSGAGICGSQNSPHSSKHVQSAADSIIRTPTRCCEESNRGDPQLCTAENSSAESNSRNVTDAATSPVKQSVSGLAASLGKHEQIISRLRHQLNDSLIAHQQRLIQELQKIIHATAQQAAAGAAAGAAASAAAAVQWAQAAAVAAIRGDAHSATQPVVAADEFTQCTATAYSPVGSVDVTLNTISSSGMLRSGQCQAVDADVLQLQTAAAKIQALQQQVDAAEAKLAMHRAAAVAAKQRIQKLEEFMAHQQQLHDQRVLQALLGRPQNSSTQHQQQEHNYQQQSDVAEEQSSQLASSAVSAADCKDNCGSSTHHDCPDMPLKNLAAHAHTNHQQCVEGLSCSTAATANEEPQQQEELSQGPSKSESGWALISSPRPNPAGGLQHLVRLKELQHQASSYHDQLRMAILDNTVLCYECMHLQHLLVQERLVGRNACQAVGLQLASDVVTLRMQLEDAQLELGVQQFARKVAGLSGEQQLDEQHVYMGSCSHGATLTAAAGIEECIAQCRASLTPVLEENRAHSQATLHHLDSRLTAISTWYEDSSWADGVQQQLAAIEQAFAQGSRLLGSTEDQQTAHLLVESCSAVDGNCETAGTTAPSAACTGTSSSSKPYVTTPSGHVSLMASRRATHVLAPFEDALQGRTSTAEAGSAVRRASRLRTCSLKASSVVTDGSLVGAEQGMSAVIHRDSACHSSGAMTNSLSGAGAVHIGASRSPSMGLSASGSAQQHSQLDRKVSAGDATQQQQQHEPARRITHILFGAAERLSAEQQQHHVAQPAAPFLDCLAAGQPCIRDSDASSLGGCVCSSSTAVAAADDSLSEEANTLGSGELCDNEGACVQLDILDQPSGGASSNAALELIYALHQAAVQALSRQAEGPEQQVSVPVEDASHLANTAVATAADVFCDSAGAYSEPEHSMLLDPEQLQQQRKADDSAEESFWDAEGLEEDTILCKQASGK